MAAHAIEIDPAVLAGTGSDYDTTGYNTATESLTSSINEYIIENNRRYHTYYGADRNLIPTDDTEQDRMDLHHEIFLQLVQGLHKVPLTKPQKILDIGTGTGIWAVDMADKYPSAEVIGTDLSPIQPKWVPPNCRFEIDDMERDWLYRPESFDLIHARNLAQSIDNWPKLMAEIYRGLKPGGAVELGEMVYSDDNTMEPDNALKIAITHMETAMNQLNRPFPGAGTLKKRLEDAGFVGVREFAIKHPYGPWPLDKRLKQAGAMAMLASQTGIEAYGMACYTRVLKMDPKEAKRICDDAAKALWNKNVHMYNHFYVAYGFKPE